MKSNSAADNNQINDVQHKHRRFTQTVLSLDLSFLMGQLRSIART
jgi:hypothetical protein